jgi:hypothetical protein
MGKKEEWWFKEESICFTTNSAFDKNTIDAFFFLC